nr:unnamed protein product [Callosobruchus chinensis]
MGINQFADLTKEEFKKMMSLRKAQRGGKLMTFNGEVEVPNSVDWRKLGAVTEVRNQGDCGSCWAFSAAAAIEGQVFIHKKILETLSPQNLMDCATGKYGNFGCHGGDQRDAFKYVIDQGILTEKEYPYTETDGTCIKKGGLKISDVGVIAVGDELALTHAIANKGPISGSMDSSGLQFYKKGVLDNSHCSNTDDDLDHAVLLVGYEKNYYIVKNSFGTGWGESGYFRILRNNNTCGISLDNSYPIL